MKISVVGTGYVGLVTGACLAERGHHVICVDKDNAKVARINSGETPIFERGLELLLKKNLAAGRLKATTDLMAAVQATEASFIAVGTPFDGNEIDLGQIRKCSQEIGAALKGKSAYHLVIVKSTVVPGTTGGVVLEEMEAASGKKAGPDFGLGMNPEFLREGEAVDDFMQPDRIVLGALDAKSSELMREIYAVFPDTPKVEANTQTAEIIKYASNSFLATLISFSNDIANYCSRSTGVDVTDVIQALTLDKRFSPILPGGERVRPGFLSYLDPGCGYGGSCFPKDTKALTAHARKLGSPLEIVESVIKVNRGQPNQLMALARKHFSSMKGVRVTVLGVAFKPDTDDVRESPALPILKALQEEGAEISIFDPIVKQDAIEAIMPGLRFKSPSTLEASLDGADAVFLITKWKEFAVVPELLRRSGKNPLVVDGRRFWNKKDFSRYEGIGLAN